MSSWLTQASAVFRPSSDPPVWAFHSQTGAASFQAEEPGSHWHQITGYYWINWWVMILTNASHNQMNWEKKAFHKKIQILIIFNLWSEIKLLLLKLIQDPLFLFNLISQTRELFLMSLSVAFHLLFQGFLHADTQRIYIFSSYEYKWHLYGSVCVSLLG